MWLRVTLALAQRELVRFFRQKIRVAVALLTPLLFWLFLGFGLGDSFRPSSLGDSSLGYLEFFFPGAVLLVLLFTAIFSTIGLIQDRQSGFLQGVLVSPAPRSAIVFGKILGGTTIGLIQAVLCILVAPLVGVPVAWSGLPFHLVAMFLVGFSMSSMGFFLAWKINSVQGFHGVMNLILMPMWLLSGAFFPLETAPSGLAWMMRLNPMTYGLAVARRTLGQPQSLGGDLPSNAACLAILAVFGGFFLLASTWLIGREAGK